METQKSARATLGRPPDAGAGLPALRHRHPLPQPMRQRGYISQRIDLTNMNAYIAKKKNETETEFPYTMFHLVLAALMKTITPAPQS